MKLIKIKEHILLFFILCFCIQAKAQTSVYHPFPDSNAVWRIDAMLYSPTQSPIYRYYQYFIGGDTLIGGVKWNKLLIRGYEDHPYFFYDSILRYLIRNDTTNKIIYFEPSFPNPQGTCGSCDSILFDFSLAVGDTIPDSWECVTYSVASPWIFVSNIDSILIGNNYRKRFHLTGNGGLFNEELIEGIGSSLGLFEELTDNETSNSLVCFMQNDTTIYPYLNAPCNLLYQGIHDPIDQNSINIFPNPVLNELHIVNKSSVIHSLKKIYLYDLLGEEIFSFEVINNQITLNTAFLRSGIYILKLENELSQSLTRKIIKL